MKWHYGPTKRDSDPSKRWHSGCEGEVWYLENGYICNKCGDQNEESDDECE